LKNCSTAHPYEPIEIDRSNPDIHIGDKASDDSQIRPYVIFFDEDLDKRIWKKAVLATNEANYFIVVGSSLKVFPAADLLQMTKGRIIIVDKEDVELPDSIKNSEATTVYRMTASQGMFRVYLDLLYVETVMKKRLYH